jgi:cell division protein FtsL
MAAPVSQSHALGSSLPRHSVAFEATGHRTAMRWVLPLIIAVSACIIGITWKNVEFKRVSIDLAQSQKELSELTKEKQQLVGEIKALSSYPSVAAWAEKQFGWRLSSTPPQKIVIPRDELSSSAQERWNMTRVLDE